MTRTVHFLLGLAIILVVGVSFFWSRFYLREQPISGDEPHYLLISHSILQDSDFDLRNDFETRRYAAYHPLPLDPTGHVYRPEADNQHWYGIHGPGLPLLLAPAVGLIGKNGDTLMMLLVSLVTLYLAYLWCYRVTGRRVVSAAAVGVLFLSVSYLSLSGTVYPDLLLAATLLGSLLLLERSRLTKIPLAGIGLLAGITPWLHTKGTLMLGTVALLAAWRVIRTKASRRHRLTALGALAAPAILLGGLFLWKFHGWFGSWSPSQVYSTQLWQLSPLYSLPAAAFDAGKGWLTNNPGWLLLFVGLPLWYRHDRSQLGRLALILVPTVLISATFGDWWGGYSPPGRYLLEILPALFPALALALTAIPRTRLLGGIALVLLSIQLWMAGTAVATNARWTTVTDPNPVLVQMRQLGVDLTHWLPKFGPTPQTHPVDWRILPPLLTVAALTVYGTRIKPTRKRSRAR